MSPSAPTGECNSRSGDATKMSLSQYHTEIIVTCDIYVTAMEI